jgi:4'-phosphopantetheinyl transferase
MLRTILARYLGREPKDIPLIKTEHGKPTCRDRADLSFSLAHAQGAVLIAVTIGCEVGVDVEQVRPMPDATDLVRRYFSPREMRRFLATEEPERDRAFFRLWTRKEAYLKALGLGLSEPLDSFDVTFGADEPVRVQRGRSGPWSLFHLEPFPTFVGALAVRGEVGRLAGGVIYPTPERVPS